jgi:hypothetical protein
MSKLPPEEIRKREVLKTLLDDELFAQAMYDVRRDLADQMLRTNDAAEREKLFYESQLMNRLQNKLTEYTNELLFLKKDEAA